MSIKTGRCHKCGRFVENIQLYFNSGIGTKPFRKDIKVSECHRCALDKYRKIV